MGVSHTSANWKVSGEQRLHRNAGDYERVVLWMEHDSWDQLVLGRLLAHYANGKRPRVLELIAADEFPVASVTSASASSPRKRCGCCGRVANR
jgi:hypothetical protein